MSLTKQDLKDIRGVIVDSVGPMFEETNLKIDGLEHRMDGLEGRMDNLEGRMDNLEGRMDNLEGRMDNLETEQHSTNRRLDSIESILQDIDGRLIALYNDVIELYKITKNFNLQLSPNNSSSYPMKRRLYNYTAIY